MTLLQSILLGILQGLTEFLPISSSAHLILAQELLGLPEADLLFGVLVHLGTLIAVCTAFRTTIGTLFKSFFQMGKDCLHGRFSHMTQGESRRMIVLLFLSLLPLIPVYLWKDFIEPLLVSPLIAGICLTFNGLMLILCDMAPEGTKTAATMTRRDALFVGLIQSVAVFPGISRSGSTITAGLCRGLDRTYAASYSFILSLPTILGGALLELIDALSSGIDPHALPFYLAGMVAAALSGFAAIRLLQRILRSKRFVYFAIYSFIIGIVTILRTVF